MSPGVEIAAAIAVAVLFVAAWIALDRWADRARSRLPEDLRERGLLRWMWGRWFAGRKDTSAAGGSRKRGGGGARRRRGDRREGGPGRHFRED
ncbi:hypothetical protein WG922_14040 [Ramlibacter sp. AN1015]|uniref:hypothetical protein n=1 Tax=Ramlibacter sp. AN1015 TaxID=3133428 RepID=UPI0030C184A2